MKETIKRMKTIEYFIGLTKDRGSGEWRWISDNSKVNATKGKFPWAKDQPGGDGYCAVVYKEYRQDNGEFNDLSCTNERHPGYICESPANINDQEGMSYKLSSFLFRLTVYFFFQIEIKRTCRPGVPLVLYCTDC